MTPHGPPHTLTEPRTLGQRSAEAVAHGMGSWRFLVIQTIVIVLWILVNLIGLILRWDPYPFILLNLVFSTQAAYAAPVILMASNRQAEVDRLHAENAYAHIDEVNAKQDRQLDELLHQTELLLSLVGASPCGCPPKDHPS